jgi:hypothetical protein
MESGMSQEVVPKNARERLTVLYEMYSSGEYDYMKQSTRLNIEEWSRSYAYKRGKDDVMDALSKNNAALKRLGTPRISRQQVFDIFSDDGSSLVEGFVAVMAWGFKPDSYGPYRTSVMLSRPREKFIVDEVLKSVASIDDPVSAYLELANTLEGLGPAFGTKYLYFTSSVENRAPILDAVVAKWLWRYDVRSSSDKWISPVGWNVKLYERYVQFCTEICELLGMDDRGLVEYLMFVDAQYSDYLELGKTQPLWITSAAPLGWPVNKTL